MIKKLLTINLLLLTTSCSFIGGPDGYFPSTKEDFLKEKVEEDIRLPDDLKLSSIENHYPVTELEDSINTQGVPKPRQIFATSGNSSVQLRRLVN